jgi:glycerol kinase
VGISLATTRKHIFSAILESILFRVYDNLILKDCEEIAVIFADGGMTRNTKMMQSQCDLLNKRLVHRERDTCWGVAKGVLTSCGVDFGGF